MKLIQFIKVFSLFLVINAIQLEGMDVGQEPTVLLCQELDCLLENGDYSQLLATLDTSVVQENIEDLDWVLEVLLSELNVPLLHWVVYHKLFTCAGLMSSSEIEHTLMNILYALIRTKMDEIVCRQLNGNRAGENAYEILRKQYVALLRAKFRDLDRLNIVKFQETCEQVFNFFTQDSQKNVFGVLGSPLWVGHVCEPSRFFGGRIIFGNPTLAEKMWSLGEEAKIRADITEERLKVFAEFKVLIKTKTSWKELLEESFEDFRNTEGFGR